MSQVLATNYLRVPENTPEGKDPKCPRLTMMPFSVRKVTVHPRKMLVGVAVLIPINVVPVERLLGGIDTKLILLKMI